MEPSHAYVLYDRARGPRGKYFELALLKQQYAQSNPQKKKKKKGKH